MTVFEKIKDMNHKELADFLHTVSNEHHITEYFCGNICSGECKGLCSLDDSNCIEDFDVLIPFMYFLNEDYEVYRSRMRYAEKYSEINKNE